MTTNARFSLRKTVPVPVYSMSDTFQDWSFMGDCLKKWEVAGNIRKLSATEKDELQAEYAQEMKHFNDEYLFDYQVRLLISIVLMPALIGFIFYYFVKKHHRKLQNEVLNDAYKRALFISSQAPRSDCSS